MSYVDNVHLQDDEELHHVLLVSYSVISDYIIVVWQMLNEYKDFEIYQKQFSIFHLNKPIYLPRKYFRFNESSLCSKMLIFIPIFSRWSSIYRWDKCCLSHTDWSLKIRIFLSLSGGTPDEKQLLWMYFYISFSFSSVFFLSIHHCYAQKQQIKEKKIQCIVFYSILQGYKQIFTVLQR